MRSAKRGVRPLSPAVPELPRWGRSGEMLHPRGASGRGFGHSRQVSADTARKSRPATILCGTDWLLLGYLPLIARLNLE